MKFRFQDQRDWFFRERFGMFVHWGIYAVEGWHEQLQWRRGVPRAEYVRLAEQFNPVNFRPDAWLDLCEEAGMSYLCFTAKHHDGFCMWDTAQTDYNIMHTPYRRDVLAMLAEACHRRGIRLGLYYSCPDWHHPNSLNFGRHHQLPQPNPGDQPDLLKYIDFVQRQLVELCSNYGEISEFFWDIPQEMNFPQLNATIRRLQPSCLINDRGYGPGDYSTPEREIPPGEGFDKPTEACDSVGRCSWGYRKNEDYYTPLTIQRNIDKMLARGGNFLLNVGPKPDGTIPEEAVGILRKVGAWYKEVRKAFDAEPFAFEEAAGNACLTRADDGTLYVHFPDGLASSGFELPCDRLPKAVTLLNNGRRLLADLEVMPAHALQAGRLDLHIFGLDAEALLDTVPVIQIDGLFD